MTTNLKEILLNESGNFTERGREVVSTLERVYQPLSSRIRNKYPYYTDEEKLNYLATKNYREKRVKLSYIVKTSKTPAPMELDSLLSSLSALDWCSYNLTELEDAEKKINVILEDIMAAKELIEEEGKKSLHTAAA